MNRELDSALAYFRSMPFSPWKWAENGSVIVWRDGTTIAFREEIVEVVAALDPNKLPSFGSIVLFFMACRNRMPKPSEILYSLVSPESPEAEVVSASGLTIPCPARATVEQLLAKVKEIALLPETLRGQTRAKCRLAEALFEDVFTPVHLSRISLQQFAQRPLSDEKLNASEDTLDLNQQVHDLTLLCFGFSRHSLASLELRARTGLETLPEAADLPVLPSDRARRLVDELLKDTEHRMVGQMARELMAAVRLPRQLSQQEDLPSGGVSDLSNRGHLDRLLLSELAHDDLTLVMRIALNESLYLRHETPAHHPPTSLCILLDSGIRIWGLPRVFATAAALAMVISESKSACVKTWRAKGSDVRPVALLHREGIIDHLGQLEIEAHPGAALNAFDKATSLECGEHARTVLITHPEVLTDIDFLRCLSESKVQLSLIATVDREGRFALHPVPLSSRDPICASQLDLDQLLAGPKSTPSLRRTDGDPNLPALLNVHPCPLLLPFAGRVEYWSKHPNDSHLAALSDRRLIAFTHARQGGRLLVPRLPSGRTLWLERIGEAVHLVRGGANHRSNRLISLEPGKQARLIDLCAGEPAKAVHRCGDALLLIRERDVYAYSIRDGELLDRALSPHRWHRGRFFSSAQQFFFVHWNGSALTFDPVTLPERVLGSNLVTIFDREGHEGPWVLNQLCQAFSLSSADRLQIPLPIGHSSHQQNINVSRDGHRIYVTIPTLSWQAIYDLKSGSSEVLRRPLSNLDRLDPSPPMPSWNLYRSFDALAIAPGELIQLRSRKGTWRAISLEENTRLRLVECRVPHPEITHAFQPACADAFRVHGCSLEAVDFPSGSRVFLDSRGMLHLRSRQETLAEISLVLSEGDMAAWCSDQTVCGPAFFFEKLQTSNSSWVFEQLNAFTKSL